jgi:tRNA(Ser,Leu) C12 N-acetylase TAN1
MAWIDDLALSLGEDPLSEQEITDLLSIAREIAHRVERKITPISTFVVGSAVARRIAAGTPRDVALRDVTAEVTSVLPPAEQGNGTD